MNTPHTAKASGNIVNFRTDIEALLKSCRVYFLPVQAGSGDPSPSNIRPITGWDGVEVYRASQNLLPLNFPPSAFYGIFGTDSTVIDTSAQRKCFTIYVGKNRPLFFQKTDGAGLSIAFCDEPYTSRDDAVIYDALNMQNRYFAAMNSGDHPYVIISAFIEDMVQGGIYDTTECMLSFGNSEKIYSPRSDLSTFPISWTQQGTVYGGYVDLTSGELVKEWELVDLGTLSWTYSSTYDWFNSTSLRDVIKKPATSIIVANAICSSYTIIPQNDNTSKKGVAVWTSGNLSYLNSGEYASIEDFVSAVSDVQFAYALETPQLIATLTPTQIKTLKGINNIYSNADRVSIKYWLH